MTGQKKTKRRANDCYQTPAEVIDAFVPLIDWPRVRSFLEPCAGQGRIIRDLGIDGDGHVGCGRYGGNFDRRLYGGACAASSRSSRTPASSPCAHSTWSTASARFTISRIRLRGSAPVKYWPTRRRRSTAVPT